MYKTVNIQIDENIMLLVNINKEIDTNYIYNDTQ